MSKQMSNKEEVGDNKSGLLFSDIPRHNESILQHSTDSPSLPIGRRVSATLLRDQYKELQKLAIDLEITEKEAMAFSLSFAMLAVRKLIIEGKAVNAENLRQLVA